MDLGYVAHDVTEQLPSCPRIRNGLKHCSVWEMYRVFR